MNKESIDVIMGPIQNVNLCIAPAFFASQVDIFGPFKSYSSVNKRAWHGVVVSMFDFHRSDRGSNPGRGGEFS